MTGPDPNRPTRRRHWSVELLRGFLSFVLELAAFPVVGFLTGGAIGLGLVVGYSLPLFVALACAIVGAIIALFAMTLWHGGGF